LAHPQQAEYRLFVKAASLDVKEALNRSRAWPKYTKCISNYKL